MQKISVHFFNSENLVTLGCRHQSKMKPIQVVLNFCSFLLNELMDGELTVSSVR